MAAAEIVSAVVRALVVRDENSRGNPSMRTVKVSELLENTGVTLEQFAKMTGKRGQTARMSMTGLEMQNRGPAREVVLKPTFSNVPAKMQRDWAAALQPPRETVATSGNQAARLEHLDHTTSPSTVASSEATHFEAMDIGAPDHTIDAATAAAAASSPPASTPIATAAFPLPVTRTRDATTQTNSGSSCRQCADFREAHRVERQRVRRLKDSVVDLKRDK
jgi:hypothetical protein